MGRFRFLDHTAEMGIRAEGEDLEDTFSAAAQGMFAWLTDLERVEEREARPVSVSAPDREALLVTFLNELNYLWEVGRFLPHRVEVREVREGPTGASLTAVLHGETWDPSRHPIHGVMKSATYHRLSVRQTPQGWEAQVILDI